MKVFIDPYAGFCFGVKKAVGKAETALRQQKRLFCLGEIVHNPSETKRLSDLGLTTIDAEQYNSLTDTSVMIRAHGEPPETFSKARKKHLKLLDATCPIVLKLQKRVSRAYSEVKDGGGTVVIAGSKKHPEVLGLLGHTEGKAVVVETLEDINRINIHAPIRFFSQTTLDPERFSTLVETLKNRMLKSGQDPEQLNVFNTICGHVKNRIPKLKSFCSTHDVILFVSGRESSNGKALFKVCKEINSSSHFITGPDELNPNWILGKSSVGISGATSTPVWLMEAVADKLKEQ